MLDIKIGGSGAKRIKAALLSVVGATIHSKSTLYLKSRRRYLEEAFHLYEKVAFAGDSLPDGGVADAVYVVLASWYLENLNANYVAPLDFEYLRYLESPLASRMYELLHHWFFISFRAQKPTFERRYGMLCSYFPLARQDTLWKAKKQLRDAHRLHLENGYLACLPEWRPINGTRKDWTLVYTPGPKAHAEYRRNQGRRDQDGIAPDELLPGAQRLLPLPVSSGPSPGDLQRDLIRELEVLGISHDIAVDLVKNHEPAYLQQKIEAFHWLMSKPDRPITTNPAGYLRESIEKNYAPPAGFLSREERARKAAEEAAQLEAKKKEEAKALRDREERTSSLEARWAALPEQERATLRARVLANLNDFARRKLQEEERDGRRSVGHATLEAEIFKLLEAEKP